MLVAALAITLSFTSCSEDESPSDMNPQTIVDIAASNSQFSTLVAALQKADLADVLSGSGSFTVFAPTNAAFDQLFDDLGVSGLADLSAETLKPILLYHVVSSKVLSTQLQDGYVSTLSEGPQQNKVSLQVSKQDVKLNGTVSVTSVDILASNGVIHVIDKVLLPPTVVGIAVNNAAFSTLVQAVVKADLAATLSGTGPFTVFAPTNAAFTALFADLGVTGIADLTKEQLTPILLYHVVSGNVLSSQLSTGSVTTLNGSLDVSVGMDITLNGSTKVVIGNVQGTNGVIHAIDKVLLPVAK